MKRINMRKIREVFRLKFECKQSNARIARSVGIGETTVEQYLFRARRGGFTWPLPTHLDDEQLEAVLYPVIEEPSDGYELPDFQYIHKEIKKKGVTLQILWEEYTSQKKGYSYSRFCDLYKEWRVSDETWMPQIHKAGVNTFVDYSGLTVPIFDVKTGLKDFDAQVFVASLGASNYLFCEATRSQTQEDWIGSHKRMSEFFGGVTECWNPDNLKSGVKQADRYEPDINHSYLCLAQHCGVSVIPARVRKPKDKSKAEGGVYLTETQILARLRDRKFFSLEELNEAIRELLIKVNQKPFQKMPGSSRYSLYLEVDKPSLKPLPNTPYELFHWGQVRVNPSYHVMIEQVRYSVPYSFINKLIEFRHNERTVEFFHRGKSIAIHQRSFEKNAIITNDLHRPQKHQYQAKCTPEEIKKEATSIGECVLSWVDKVLEDQDFHIRQRTNTALGVVRLIKTFPKERLNMACKRGLFYGLFTRKSIKNMLETKTDLEPLPEKETTTPLPQQHINVRGAGYYL